MAKASEMMVRAAPPVERAAIKRVSDVNSRWVLPILVGLSVVVFAGLLYLTRYMNFYYDEWDFVSWQRSWSLNQVLLPHNEHWSTIPILIWKLLFVVVGLRSHIPYEAALLVAHVASVLLLFTIVRRGSGDLPAFAAGLTLLLLGSGGANITWAFQIGFVGSVAFGLCAMLLLDSKSPFPWRLPAASVSLLCSLMCSNVGLAFAAAIGMELVADRKRWTYLIALIPPAVAFGAWFVVFDTGKVPGSPGTSASLHHATLGWDYVTNLAGFVGAGLEATAAGTLGLPASVGAAILPIFAALVAIHWYRQGHIKSWQVGMTGGALSWFAFVGLGRAQNGISAATDSHYLYVAAVFLLPLIADAAGELRWRPLLRPVFVAALALALFSNAMLLRDYARSLTDITRNENAQLQTIEVFRGAPDMAMYRPLDTAIMPQLVAARYFAAIDQLGSPVPLANLNTLQQLPPQPVDEVMRNVFGDALTVTPDTVRSTNGLSCHEVDSTTGSVVTLVVPNAQSMMLQPSSGGEVSLYLWFVGQPPTDPLRRLQIAPTIPEWVRVPNTGKPITWHLQLKTVGLGTLRVCSGSKFAAQDARLVQASAQNGSLGPGWMSVGDPASSTGRAAKAVSGATHAVNGVYANDTFGAAAVPTLGSYDVWYRVKVDSVSGSVGEMRLGLWDDTGSTWVGSSVLKASKVASSYVWLKACSDVVPTAAHIVQFQASIESTLGTSWYIDEAVMMPSGSAGPG